MRCSIVIPVHGQAALTRRCLEALFARPSSVGAELIVVDDASRDPTPELRAGYGDRIRVVRRLANGGFAAACNEGAAEASGELLLFLNNDTIPQAGWLDALVAYTDAHPDAAIVGSKLLFPNDTIQHAGVVICQDGLPRHVYAGFPAEHPAVSRSRRFQAVTAACMLVRREAFEEAGGFDAAYVNCLEDADLCLRLGALGHEIHYCHESVLYHLESVSRGRRSRDIDRNVRLFRGRWDGRIRPDDVDYYLEDGLLRIGYEDTYPVRLSVSPLLGTLDGISDERRADRQLRASQRQIVDLLRETVRLTVEVAERELDVLPTAGNDRARYGDRGGKVAGDFFQQVEAIEAEIHKLQAAVAESAQLPFAPSPAFGYRKLLDEIRHAVRDNVPAGATVLVVSRGDDELLDLDGRLAWHVPRDEHGAYAGYHPADGAAAVTEIERLRSQGGEYLLFPETALWWLDHYAGLREHLDDRYSRLLPDGESCVIFALNKC